ncbi:DUF2867 domain-containing protein [Hymenobacter ruricola]|uniref:DUF2867 domain-containing protein n=1 Tax=Hymenobacter ruricola TaxID=2791023 RepID=UPI00293D24DF|nr:DUF2867 domain-containing protein [Hymenobacter ruricola]
MEQLAAYRPRGLAGRLYWYSVLPFHGIIFKGMVKNLVANKPNLKSQTNHL